LACTPLNLCRLRLVSKVEEISDYLKTSTTVLSRESNFQPFVGRAHPGPTGILRVPQIPQLDWGTPHRGVEGKKSKQEKKDGREWREVRVRKGKGKNGREGREN